MTKLKKDLKKILLAVFGLMLLFNAGFDFARWNAKRAVEKKVAAGLREVTEGLANGAGARVVNCFPAVGEGWICDLELTAPNGNSGRVIQFVTDDDLQDE